MITEKKTALIGQIVQRLKSNTPEFFKRIQRYALGVLTVSGIFTLILEADIWNPSYEKQLVEWTKIIAAVAAGIAGTTTTATTNPILVDDKTKERILDHAQSQGEIIIKTENP